MNPFASPLLHSDRRLADRAQRPRLALLAAGMAALAVALVTRVCAAQDRPEAPAPSARAVPLDRLLSQLRNPSPLRRREALLALADSDRGPESVLPAIWPLLADTDPIVRAQAARAAWVVGGRADAAAAVLTPLLEPAHPQACALASFLLGEIGPPAAAALPALQARMTEADPLLRLHAAEAIIRIDAEDPAAHAALIHALRDPASEVRYFAACALLHAGPDFRAAARSALLGAVSDDDLRVATAAAMTSEHTELEPSAPRRFEPGREPALSSPEVLRLKSALGDAGAAARRQAALRLAELGAPAASAVPALDSALADADPLARAYAACALWRLTGDAPALLPALIDLLGTTRPNVTTLAAFTLGEMGAPAADALPALYDVLETAEPLVRLHAATAICRIDHRDREAVGVVSTAAQDRDSDLRHLAALSLGQVSPLFRKRAERELAVLLRDRNLRVRAAAERALDRLRAPRPAATVTLTLSEPDADETLVVADEELPGASDLIPALDEAPQIAPPAPLAPSHSDVKDYDVDEETLEERKTIGQLRARITPSAGDFPADHFEQRFGQEPALYHGDGAARGWYGLSYAWNNTGLCYNPLYCQDLNLERYGYHYGCFQTVVSSIKFCADAALLPYAVVAQSPCDCQYTLGYDRPGNCVPYRCYRLPWRTDAALILGGVATGLVFLAP